MLNLFQHLIICLHSLDVFLRKHFVRLCCKLTYSSCKRLFFSIFFQKICKEKHSCSRLLQTVVQDRGSCGECTQYMNEIFSVGKYQAQHCLQTLEASPERRDSETSLPVGSQIRKDRSNFLPAKNESIAVSSRENKKNVKLSRTVQ